MYTQRWDAVLRVICPLDEPQDEQNPYTGEWSTIAEENRVLWVQRFTDPFEMAVAVETMKTIIGDPPPGCTYKITVTLGQYSFSDMVDAVDKALSKGCPTPPPLFYTPSQLRRIRDERRTETTTDRSGGSCP